MTDKERQETSVSGISENIDIPDSGDKTSIRKSIGEYIVYQTVIIIGLTLILAVRSFKNLFTYQKNGGD